MLHNPLAIVALVVIIVCLVLWLVIRRKKK
jgi:LPXTG-motif cell wall-anchored protein